MTALTACLIVRDEQARLPACLASVAFCDEIVVVDGGSRDATVSLARAAGARVVENPWPGYSRQRNVALDHASHEWVLEIDADERVTPPLAREIQAFLIDPPDGIDIAATPLRHRFLGLPMGPSARYPMYRYRLFRRTHYRHDERRQVHEGLWADGPVHPFAGDLDHHLADSWREALADRHRYAYLEARHLEAPSGLRPYLVGAVLRPAAKVAWRTIVLGGWRDGWRGMAVIGLDALSDGAVWMILAGRRLRRGAGAANGDAHFGRPRHGGATSIVALASGSSAAAQAAAWVAELRALGADARLRAPRRFGPLSVIRALDAEQQLRPIDLMVLFGTRAGLLGPRLPAQVRGLARPLSAPVGASDAIARALAARAAAGG